MSKYNITSTKEVKFYTESDKINDKPLMILLSKDTISLLEKLVRLEKKEDKDKDKENIEEPIKNKINFTWDELNSLIKLSKIKEKEHLEKLDQYDKLS